MKRVLATAVMSAAVLTFASVPVVLADNSRLAAHRADNSRFPQNTVAAIKSAVREGALQRAACRECLNLSVINDMKEVI